MTATRSILYIGPDSGTCRARRLALVRLGHHVRQVDPFAALPLGGLARSWSFKTGGFGFGAMVRNHIAACAGGETFDLAYVDSGELIDGKTVQMLRRFAPVVANYNPDNPYVRRDGSRWRAFLGAVPHYDCLFVPRESNVAQAKLAGARQAHRVWFAADDALRDPARLPSEEAKRPYRSSISFVGTWMPERGPFLLKLARAGLPLQIFGPRWNKAPEYAALEPLITLGELSPQAYDAAVAAADISIALLSQGNRDQHTTRSMEIPVLGSLLCGERTTEHLRLYEEGREALFWSDAQECIDHCRQLLADPGRRRRIADAGRARALRNDHFNEPLMRSMLDLALDAQAAPSTRSVA
ncbi:CgeB family protein [Sphingobium mellinum]|uniref:CgeB family protein n=1 Tax=Sphingobium mellinum TaxID=1387166 RepID=UPI0030ECC748